MPWLNLTTHVAAITAAAATGSWVLRRSADAVLRLMAGLVAILACDKRPHADRALEVLRTTQEARTLRGHIGGPSSRDLPGTDENR
jgi:hypothetical protein